MVDSRVEGVMVVSEVVVPLRMKDPGVDLRVRQASDDDFTRGKDKLMR